MVQWRRGGNVKLTEIHKHFLPPQGGMRAGFDNDDERVCEWLESQSTNIERELNDMERDATVHRVAG